jgi:uncharacterized protein YgiM (DUF1202 family)
MFIKTLLIVLALAQFACTLSTIPTPTPAGPADNRAVVRHEQEQKQCVRAQTDLHIRAEPSEKSRVLFWLYEGQTATVKDIVPNWTLITIGNVTGFARSKYLTETECK